MYSAELLKARGRTAHGIWFEFAFIPLLSRSELEGAGQHDDRAHFIGMPMRHIFPTGRELHSRDEDPGFAGIAVSIRWTTRGSGPGRCWKPNTKQSKKGVHPVVGAVSKFKEIQNFLQASVSGNLENVSLGHTKSYRVYSRRAALIRHGSLQADAKHCVRAEGH